MDAHQIPQNVTAFEFHLIGDMTLKQFAYLASGLFVAYLAFYFLLAPYPVIAIPIVIISSSVGAAFAFLPIFDRPLDHWVKAYFSAIMNPTQRTWQSPTNSKLDYKEDQVFKNRFKIYRSPQLIVPLAQTSATDMENTAQAAKQPTTSPSQFSSSAKKSIDSILSRFTQGSQVLPSTQDSARQKVKNVDDAEKVPTVPIDPQKQTMSVADSKLPTEKELNKMVILAKESQLLQTKIVNSEKQINQMRVLAQTDKKNSPEYQEQLKTTYSNLQTLIKQAQALSSEMALENPKPAPLINSAAAVVVPAPKTQKTQIVLTSTPNVVNGIAVDTEGNYLEGVIVIIHNAEGLPVRALKTNKLGQFTGATPLPAGVYTLTLEKDNLVFDTLQVTLKGEVLPALQVAAKSASTINQPLTANTTTNPITNHA